MACKTEHPLPHVLESGMPVQRDDSCLQKHADDSDAIMKLHVVGKGGGRMSILTLDPTQSADSKQIFEQVKKLSAKGDGEIDLQSLLKTVATQEELKATVHRQKKMIGKLIFGFAAITIALFAVTLGSSLLSGNLIKELYVGPSSEGANEEPDSANGARLLQDASGNVVATGIAKKVFPLMDLASMSDAELLRMTRVTMHVGGAIRHYEVDAVAKRCGVVQVQSQKASIFVDDSYVSILGLDGEREVLEYNPRTKCDESGCRRLTKCGGGGDFGDEIQMCTSKCVKKREGPFGEIVVKCRGTICNCVKALLSGQSFFGFAKKLKRGSPRRLEDRPGPRADLEVAAKGSEGALLDAAARQLLSSQVSPPAVQLQCGDTLEDVLDHTCALDTNYSVQCPHDCDCKSAEESIYGCNPYTADSRICCAALLHGVQHPATFLIHTAGAQDNFKACTFADSTASHIGLRDMNEVMSQSAGPYPRSFKVFGDKVGVNISAFRRDDLGHSVDQLSGVMDEIGESMSQVDSKVEMMFDTVRNLSKAVTVLLEVAELNKGNLTKGHLTSEVAR